MPPASHWQRHRWAWLIGGAYVCIAIWVWWACHVGPKVNADAGVYAQMGRELRRGHGFATMHLMPRQIPFLAEHGYLHSEHWYNFARFPLPAITDAAFCFVTDDAMLAAVFKSGTFFVLSVPLLFLLAYRHTNLAVAMVSTLFFMADPLVFYSSYVGKTETLSIFLILCVMLTTFARRLTLGKCALLGALVGLCYLARTQFVYLVPVLFILIGFRVKGRARIPAMAVMAGCALLVALPWLVRNYTLVGDPMFSFLTTRGIAVESRPIGAELGTNLHAPVATSAVLEEYGADIARKYVRHLFPGVFSLSYWGAILDPGLMPFFFLLIISLFRREEPGQKYMTLWKWTLLAMAVCNLLIAALVVLIPRYFVALYALVILLGTRELFLLLEQAPHRVGATLRAAAVIVLLVLAAWQFNESAKTVLRRTRPRVERIEAMAQIKQMTRPGTLVASDISYYNVVYTDRRSMWLPADPEQLLEIDEKYLTVDYVHLSPTVMKAGPHLKNWSSRHPTFWRYPQFVTTTPFTSKYKLTAELIDGGRLFERISEK